MKSKEPRRTSNSPAILGLSLVTVACAFAACSSGGSNIVSPTSSSGHSSSTSSGSDVSGSGSGISDDSSGDDEIGSPDASLGDDSSSGSSGSAPVGTDTKCPPNSSSISTYAPAAAPVLSALDPSHSDMLPGDGGATVPAGWNFYRIDGAMCRDGSPFGIYVKYKSMTKLVVYMEGGGLCFSSHFCDHNPANMWQQFSSDPQTMGETVGGSVGPFNPPILQQPWSTGIFDQTNPANPVPDWSMVYVPYCTGDAHFGTVDSGMITDYSNGMGSAPSPIGQTNNPGFHFVGFNNMQKVAGHLAATFTGLDSVLLTGASAGGLGAVFNATMFMETFGNKIPHPTVVIDSAAGFPDTKYMSACLQKNARTTYGWDSALPSDCKDCNQPDGSGLMNIINYLHNRYRKAKLGLLMSVHDQIFRLFYGSGMGATPTAPQNCDSNDPNVLANLGLSIVDPSSLRYPASLWEEGLGTLRTTYDCTGAFSSYYIGSQDADAGAGGNNTIDTLHMHSFRDRYYETLSGSISPAQWTADLLSGKVEDIGP